MNIYVVRHGETDWNKNNLLQGSTNIELNENGIESAKKMSEELEDIHFDIVYSSTLKRAISTAEYICKEKSYKIEVSEKLIERSFGDYEGKQIAKEQIQGFWDYDLNSDENNIEPIRSFFYRIHDFLKVLYEKYGNTNYNILLVTHNGVNIAIDSIINGFPDNFLELIMKNCEYKVFENVNIDEHICKKSKN